MKNRQKTLQLCRALALLLLFALTLSACAAPAEKTRLEKTADYLLSTVTEPACGSVGGEWTVIGLARSGCAVQDGYFDGYYERLCQTLRACGGVLDERKNTEYSRVILALTAIGKNPSDAAGYDLLLPLADYDHTVSQGLNGPIWALIALDSGAYVLPQTAGGTQASRERYLQTILDAQTQSGAWGLVPGSEDVDMTAMALQALAKYTGDAAVDAAVSRALEWLGAAQRPNGCYVSYGSENSESAAQVLVALCELGIPVTDERFVKNGSTLVDVLGRFGLDDGSFRHTMDGESDLMATEQCMYALAAADRAARGESSLYRMR